MIETNKLRKFLFEMQEKYNLETEIEYTEFWNVKDRREDIVKLDAAKNAPISKDSIRRYLEKLNIPFSVFEKWDRQ